MSSTFPGRAAIEEQFKERAFVVESSAGISRYKPLLLICMYIIDLFSK